jgi:two-component system sensor histidine kinase SenX3
MVNAARYSPDDTTIWVRVEQVEGWAEVSVRDEGIGVPDDEQGRIFERFYRGQRDEVRRIRGTGIGLAIVRELTEALGGRVWVDSVAGRGAVFTVRLPAVEATGPERPSPLGAPERSPAV